MLRITQQPSSNAELSGALVMEAKPQCKGRPVAIGRELLRLVRNDPSLIHLSIIGSWGQLLSPVTES